MRLFFLGLVLLVVFPSVVLAQGCGEHNATCCTGDLCAKKYTCTKEKICEDLMFNCVQMTPYDVKNNCQLLPSGWLDPPRSECWRNGSNCWDNLEKCQKDCTACSVLGGKCCQDQVGSFFCHNGYICSTASQTCVEKNPKPTTPPIPTEIPFTPAPTKKPEKLLGDYDGNRVVNIGDYSVWRKEFVDKIPWNKDGTFASISVSSGIVDPNGYSTWRYAFLR